MELTIGCMTWGDTTDEAEAERIFRRALDAGITRFDTAEVYSEGRSEEILGRLLKKIDRDSVEVHTKIGYDVDASFGARRSIAGCERRLDTHADMIYLHKFGALCDRNASLHELGCTVGEFRVGVSNCAAWHVLSGSGDGLVSCIQSQYSLLKRQAEVELFPMAQHEGLEVRTYSPLARGLLAGKPRGDLNPRYQRRFDDTDWQALDGFLATCRAREIDPVPLAISWAGSHPAVTSVIIGPRNVEQLERCLKAKKMTAEERAEWAIAKDPPPAHDRWEER